MSGFAFPADHLLPSHLVGMVALVFIVVAARSGLEPAGASRRVYVVATMGALYLNATVGVVQAFLKVSVLHGLAPQQTEAPFVVTQAAVLALFVGLTVVAVRFVHCRDGVTRRWLCRATSRRGSSSTV